MASSVAKVQSKERTFGWVVRRILLYIGLALAALTIFALFFALTVYLGVTDKVNSWFKSGWIGFAAYTALLFWVTVRQSRRRWHHWSFWFAIACLLTIHCLAFVAILRIYPDWRVIWFWPITVVEAGIFGATLAWLFPERHRRLKGNEKP
jgi:O-antigen/teichoic acid export membrane protein